MADESITKEGFAWIITRLIGCWFVWLAFKGASAFAFAMHLLNSSGLSTLRSSGVERLSWDAAWPGALGLFLYAGLAYYFLKKGQRFVEIICSEPLKPSADGDSAGDAFSIWLAADESRRYLSQADQHREFLASRR